MMSLYNGQLIKHIYPTNNPNLTKPTTLLIIGHYFHINIKNNAKKQQKETQHTYMLHVLHN